MTRATSSRKRPRRSVSRAGLHVAVAPVALEVDRGRQERRPGSQGQKGGPARQCGPLAEELDLDPGSREITVAQEAHDLARQDRRTRFGRGVAAQGDDVHAQVAADPEEPLVELRGFELLGHGRDLEPVDPEPPCRPFPSPEVGQGEDRADAPIDRVADLVDSRAAEATHHPVLRQVRQAEEVDPVPAVGIEDPLDIAMEPGLAERPVVGLGSNAPEVAFDHQSLVAGQVCAGEAQRAADARRDRERQVTGQGGRSPQRRGGELHLGCVRADVARRALAGEALAAVLPALRRRAGGPAAAGASTIAECRGLGRGLVPHLDETLAGGDDVEHHDHGERDQQQRAEQQTEAEDDESFGALDEATSGVESEGIGLGPDVGHERCRHVRRDRQHHRPRPAVVVRQVPGDAAEEEPVGQTVRHRVEEGPTEAGLAPRLGDGSVDQVGDARQHEEQESEVEPAGADGDGCAHRHDDSDARHHVGGDAGLADAVSDRLEPGFDLASEVTVEH